MSNASREDSGETNNSDAEENHQSRRSATYRAAMEIWKTKYEDCHESLICPEPGESTSLVRLLRATSLVDFQTAIDVLDQETIWAETDRLSSWLHDRYLLAQTLQPLLITHLAFRQSSPALDEICSLWGLRPCPEGVLLVEDFDFLATQTARQVLVQRSLHQVKIMKLRSHSLLVKDMERWCAWKAGQILRG